MSQHKYSGTVVGTDLACRRGREDDVTKAENLGTTLRLTKYKGPVPRYERS